MMSIKQSFETIFVPPLPPTRVNENNFVIYFVNVGLFVIFKVFVGDATCYAVQNIYTNQIYGNNIPLCKTIYGHDLYDIYDDDRYDPDDYDDERWIIDSAFDEESDERDFTACSSSDCGMCGKCSY
jgi:hypothetical protein